MKRWQIAEPISQEVGRAFPKLDPVLLQLLYNRGLRSQSEIDEFLLPDWSRHVPDAYLFKDMTKAVARIYEAIGQQEPIGIFGDYDADGVCAAAILASTLQKIGGRVEVYLPHREREGYGLNQNGLEYLQDKGVKLVITCDCGIANVAEIEFAGRLGLAVIVTDHHQPHKVLPPAFAILHPAIPQETYPFNFLSGGGVAFKLVQGLLRYEGCPLSKSECEAHEKWLLDLVAISTVADMVKLRGENRTLVSYGLRVLRKTRNLGLQKLIAAAGLRAAKIDTQTIGFQIAPRINAAGRLDHANAAFALLMAGSAAQAEELARALNLTNAERQKMTDSMVLEAKEQIGKIGDGEDFVYAFNKNWPLGLAGLVAGKLVQIYNRPALVMCQNNELIAGSGRAGVGNFDLVLALAKCEHLLSNYGGHKEAAGFSLKPENYETFLNSFAKEAHCQLEGIALDRVLNVDMLLPLKDLSLQLSETLTALEPYGQANPKPCFGTLDATVSYLSAVGTNGQHLRLRLAQNGAEQQFIWFYVNNTDFRPSVGDRVDVAYELGINEWNNLRQLELKLVDLRPSQTN